MGFFGNLKNTEDSLKNTENTGNVDNFENIENVVTDDILDGLEGVDNSLVDEDLEELLSGEDSDILDDSIVDDNLKKGKRNSIAKKILISLATIITLSAGIGACHYFNSSKTNDKNDKPGYSADIADTFGDLGNDLADKIQEAMDNTKENVEIENEAKEEEVPEDVSSSEEETNDLSHSGAESSKEDLVIPDIGYYDGNSVVDAILLAGYDQSFASFEYRAKLAEYFGIENYDKTAEKNTELLNALKEYAKNLRKGTEEKEPTKDKENAENKETAWVALDDDYEIRTNKDGVEEKRPHAYILTNIRYAARDDCHIVIQEFTCPNCGRVKTSSYEEDHKLSAYINNGNGTETATCYVCGYEKTKNITNDNDDQDKDQDDDKKHNHDWKLISKEIISLENGTHDVYRTYRCNFDGKERVLKKNYKCSYDDLKYNEATGKDEQICLECGYVLELEHEHDWVLVKSYIDSNNNCTHDLVEDYKCSKEDSTDEKRKTVDCNFNEDTDINYVNNHNGTHDVVESSECDDCHYTKEEILVDGELCVYTWILDKEKGMYIGTCECKATKYEKQEWKIESQKFVSNNDGTHKFVTVYVDNHGKHKTDDGSENCNFGDYKYNKDTNKDDRVCDNCDYIDSRKHIHNKGELTFDKDGEYYTCLDDPTHKVDEKPHTMKDKPEVICIPNGNRTHKVSTVLGCNTCDYKEQVELDYDEDCDFTWTLDEEKGIYTGVCKCGDTVTEKQEWTIIDTKVESNEEDKTHTITLTYQDQRGKKKTEVDTYSCEWELTNTTVTLKDDDYHTVKEDYGCKTDGCTNTKTETNDAKHDFTDVEYEYDPADGHDKRTCATTGCGFIDSMLHEHKWGEYKDFTDTGATQYCDDYEHCSGTKTHTHDFGDPYYDDNGKHQKCKDDNCNYVLDLKHEHNHVPGTLINTLDPDDYCTAIPYTCECGDSYTVGVDEHAWIDLTDIGVKVCDNCDIEVDIVKEEEASKGQEEGSQSVESSTSESSESKESSESASTETEQTTETTTTTEESETSTQTEESSESKTEESSEEKSEEQELEQQEEKSDEKTSIKSDEEESTEEKSEEKSEEQSQDAKDQTASNENRKLEQVQLALESLRRRKQVLNEYINYMSLCRASNSDIKRLSLRA